MRRSLIVIRSCWVLLLAGENTGCFFGGVPSDAIGPPGPPTTVRISAANLAPVQYVQVGDTLRLWGVPIDDAGFEVEASEAVRTWRLSASALASLDPQPPAGREVLVTGLAAGALTVTATVLGAHGTLDLTILPRLGSVVLTPAATELAVGDSVVIAAAITDALGNELSGLFPEWRFGNANVVAFRDFGTAGGLRFYALAPGTYVLGVAIAQVTGTPATIHVVTAVDQ